MGPKLINIRTVENPVWVSANTESEDPRKQDRYWRGVASGSTSPSAEPKTDQKALEILLKKR